MRYSRLPWHVLPPGHPASGRVSRAATASVPDWRCFAHQSQSPQSCHLAYATRPIHPGHKPCAPDSASGRYRQQEKIPVQPVNLRTSPSARTTTYSCYPLKPVVECLLSSLMHDIEQVRVMAQILIHFATTYHNPLD